MIWWYTTYKISFSNSTLFVRYKNNKFLTNHHILASDWSGWRLQYCLVPQDVWHLNSKAAQRDTHRRHKWIAPELKMTSGTGSKRTGNADFHLNKPRTTGKWYFAVCPRICREHYIGHTAKSLFAVSHKESTRQTKSSRQTHHFVVCQHGAHDKHPISPCADAKTHGKA